MDSTPQQPKALLNGSNKPNKNSASGCSTPTNEEPYSQIISQATSETKSSKQHLKGNSSTSDTNSNKDSASGGSKLTNEKPSTPTNEKLSSQTISKAAPKTKNGKPNLKGNSTAAKKPNKDSALGGPKSTNKKPASQTPQTLTQSNQQNPDAQAKVKSSTQDPAQKASTVQTTKSDTDLPKTDDPDATDPNNWTGTMDQHSGKIVYHNAKTHQTVSERPVCLPADWQMGEHIFHPEVSEPKKEVPEKEHEKVSEKVQKDPELNDPENWVAGKDPSTGHIFYHNAKKDVTQWERPACLPEGFETSNAPKREEGPLVPKISQEDAFAKLGWSAHYDETHKTTYYLNLTTQETQWEVPEKLIDVAANYMWTAHYSDDHGATFYHNSQTQATVWERPDV
jgi:hypothetical protein